MLDRMRRQISAQLLRQQAAFDDGGDDRACNSGSLITLVRLFPCYLALTSGPQFVLIASRNLSTSKGQIETLEVPIAWQ